MFNSLYEGALTDTSTVAKHELGALRYEGDKIYKYVKNIDVVAAAGYAMCAGSATDTNIVSADRSGGSAINSIPVGVALGAIPVDSYAWIQVSGLNTAVLSDGSVAAGEAVIAHASTDGSVDSGAAGSTVVITTHQAFGLATAADTTSRVSVQLKGLI